MVSRNSGGEGRLRHELVALVGRRKRRDHFGRCAFASMKVLTGIGGIFGDTEFGFGFDPDDFAFEAASFLKTAKIKEIS